MPFRPSKHDVSLAGKVAVVLGASAEGGTGWAIAEGLAERGAKVVVAARSFEPLKVLANRIDGFAVQCDAGSEEDIRNLANAVIAQYGHLDIAVNSAGLPTRSLIAEIDQAQLDASFRVNFFGNVFFIQRMAEAIGQDGSIIYISSMASTHPLPPHAVYASAKAASDCLIRYAALEYGPRNIRINSILPGAIRSNMVERAFDNPSYEATLRKEVPLGRIGEVEDFADAALWLATSAYVTGMNLQVNGGNHLTRFPYLHEFDGGKATFDTVQALGDRK